MSKRMSGLLSTSAQVAITSAQVAAKTYPRPTCPRCRTPMLRSTFSHRTFCRRQAGSWVSVGVGVPHMRQLRAMTRKFLGHILGALLGFAVKALVVLFLIRLMGGLC